MTAHRVTVSSRALGARVKVPVYVYDTLGEMRHAANAYNGSDNNDALGVTQARTDQDRRTVSVLIRLAASHLTLEVIVHEVHHAATALYGSQLPDRVRRRTHFTHVNESFAYLYSDLTASLLGRLRALGHMETT